MVRIAELLPRDVFRTLSWWEKLSAEEQLTVQSESRGLAEALLSHGASKLAIGEHLSKLQEVLEPKRLFVRHLKNFHFSQRTAYRYITGYSNAKARLPEPVLRAAMARGYNMIGESSDRPLGVYTEAVRYLPPPKDKDLKEPAKVHEWLDKVEERRRRGAGTRPTGADAPDPETAMKECFRFVDIRFRRLPRNSKTRSNWIRTLVGMLMTELGIGNAQSFTPVAIPSEFRAVRGRPRKDALTEEDQEEPGGAAAA